MSMVGGNSEAGTGTVGFSTGPRGFLDSDESGNDVALLVD